MESPLFTRQGIILLNNGSMTLEQAAAMFNVDMDTFKAKLKEENIFVWKEVNGTKTRIHGRDSIITMVISVPDKTNYKLYTVKGWYPFESVIRMIEEEHKLSRGFYELSYKHFDTLIGDVLIKTDLDWHEALRFFRWCNYIMSLDLKKKPECDGSLLPRIDDGSMNSTEQVPSPPPFTREGILLLNNGSMTLEQARAMFNVDMYTFKAKLKEENILVWKEVNGRKTRIHGRDYRIAMYVFVAELTKLYEVKGYYPFENVIRMIEEENELTRGFYELSYKHSIASIGDVDVLIETDRDWHEAVKFFKSNAYIMFLELKKKPGVALSSL